VLKVFQENKLFVVDGIMKSFALNLKISASAMFGSVFWAKTNHTLIIYSKNMKNINKISKIITRSKKAKRKIEEPRVKPWTYS
jgi:hypothetical protein